MGTILKVPHIEQTDEWPCGDECLCAVMLLRYLGIRISMDEFIDFFLPQEQMRRKEGQLIGPDPDLKFAGSPYDNGAFADNPEIDAMYEEYDYGINYYFKNKTPGKLTITKAQMSVEATSYDGQ